MERELARREANAILLLSYEGRRIYEYPYKIEGVHREKLALALLLEILFIPTRREDLLYLIDECSKTKWLFPYVQRFYEGNCVLTGVYAYPEMRNEFSLSLGYLKYRGFRLDDILERHRDALDEWDAADFNERSQTFVVSAKADSSDIRRFALRTGAPIIKAHKELEFYEAILRMLD